MKKCPELSSHNFVFVTVFFSYRDDWAEASMVLLPTFGPSDVWCCKWCSLAYLMARTWKGKPDLKYLKSKDYGVTFWEILSFRKVSESLVSLILLDLTVHPVRREDLTLPQLEEAWVKNMENNGKKIRKKMEKCVLHEKVSKSDFHDVSISFVHYNSMYSIQIKSDVTCRLHI